MKKMILGVIFLTLTYLLTSSTAIALDLYQIYQHALISDPQLKAAEARFLAKMEQKTQALAALKPQIDVSGSVSYNLFNNRQSIGVSNTVNANYNIQGRKTLIHQGYNKQVELSDAIIEQARAEFIVQQQQLMIRVSKAYFDFLIAQENLEFVRSEKAAIERQLKQSKAFYQVGKIAIIEVKETQAQLDLTIANEVLAMKRSDLARESLKVITGRYYSRVTGASLSTKLSHPFPEEAQEWIDIALSQSKALEVAEFAVLVEQSKVDKIKASHQPTLELFAKHSGSITRLDVDQENLDASVGLQFNMPLSRGGAIDSSVRQARHLLHQSQYNLELKRRQLVQQVKTNYLSVIGDIAKASAYARALASSEAAAKSARAGFALGTRTSLDVLLRVKEVFRAKYNLASARYEYMLDMLKLRETAGIIDESDLVKMRVHLRKVE